jgi:hypothetical protein
VTKAKIISLLCTHKKTRPQREKHRIQNNARPHDKAVSAACYAANSVQINARSNACYKANSVQINARSNACYAANSVQILAKRRAHCAANSVQILAKCQEKNLAMRLKMAEAAAHNLSVFTEEFVGNDELHALVTSKIPKDAKNARDVLLPDCHKKLGVSAPPPCTTAVMWHLKIYPIISNLHKAPCAKEEI